MPRAGVRAKPLILVVDDDEMERYLHRQALERIGFEVAEAKNGAMALALFARTRPDLVVLDVVMPEMHGFDVCVALREMPEGRDTPILMATSLDDVVSIDRAFRVGATDFIGKPINWSVLPYRVRYMLRAHDTLTKLSISEGRLAEAQRIAGLGNFRWDATTSQLECSSELLRMFGLEGGDGPPSVRALLRRIPPADRRAVLSAVRAALAGSKIDLDHRVVTPDQELRTVCLRAELSATADGVNGLQGSVQDVTERIRAERELRIARDEAQTASAAKTTFLAAMSHELRTPLNAIIGFSELISEQVLGPVSPPKYGEFAQDIRRAGQRILTVFVDVMTMAQLEAGRLELKLEDADLRSLTQAALAEFYRTELGRTRTVGFEAMRKRWPVRVDQRALKEMLLKLLSNAAKFSGAGTPIRVNVGPGSSSGYFRVSIADEGIGMTVEEAEAAVRPFQQIDARLERRYEGMGLGLAIVNKLTECHGALLTIDSVPQKGTRVSIDFPALPGLDQRPAEPERRPVLAAFAK